jgi:hypothetical protein
MVIGSAAVSDDPVAQSADAFDLQLDHVTWA